MRRIFRRARFAAIIAPCDGVSSDDGITERVALGVRLAGDGTAAGVRLGFAREVADVGAAACAPVRPACCALACDPDDGVRTCCSVCVASAPRGRDGIVGGRELLARACALLSISAMRSARRARFSCATCSTHSPTSEGMATVAVYGYEDIRAGASGIVRLKLDQPVVLVPGDRFVLRQPAPVATIGGGRILDCHPLPRQRKATTLAWLGELSDAPIREQLTMRVKRRGAAGLQLDALAREAGLTLDATRRQLDSAIQGRQILLLDGDLLLSRDALQRATDECISLLIRLVKNAGTSGIKASELRSQAGMRQEVFDRVVQNLSDQSKIQVRGESIIPGSGPAASSLESEQLDAIAEAYKAAGLAAPSVPELAQRLRVSDVEMRRLITLLQRQKRIVRMGSDDLFMHAAALDNLVARIAAMRGSLIDVAAFKQLTGLSRKYAIPLLEYLDRMRVTRKQGDQRIIL